jgi:phosphoenolpyruvate carboxykinase (GTP)
LRANGKVDAIDTPVGFLPRYEDLKELFSSLIDKEYPRELYNKQFAIYVDKIQDRIDLQREAFGKEKDLPGKLFEVYDRWSDGLAELKQQHGAIVTPDKL